MSSVIALLRKNTNNNLCVTCLSSDRRLFPINTTIAAWIGFTFQKHDKVCWECRAILTRIHKFRQQVLNVQHLLTTDQDKRAWQCVSTLGVHRKDTYDQVYLDNKETNDNISNVFIKMELIDPEESIDNYTNIKEEIDKTNDDSGSGLLECSIPINVIRPTNRLVVDVKSEDENLHSNVKREVEVKLKSVGGESKKAHGKKKLCDGVASSSRTVETRNVSSSEVSADDWSVGKGERYKPEREKHLIRNLTEEEMQQARQQQRTYRTFPFAQFKCEMCIMMFRTEKKYQDHMVKHSEAAGPFQCRVCSQRFHKEDEAREHFYDHYRVYQCCRCDFTHQYLTNVTTHYNQKHLTDGLFTCRRCGQDFPTYNEMRAHKMEKHETNTKTACKFCYKYILTKNLSLHQKRCNEPTTEVCPVCGKLYKSIETLRVHMKATHPAADTRVTHYCAQCDKTFVSSTKLKAHLNMARHKAIEYECDYCGHKSKAKQELLHHIETHLGILKYQCQHCGEKFTSGDQKYLHVRLKHRNPVRKPPTKRTCTICSKEFSCSSSLKTHKRIHDGDRPFLCNLCPMRFTQRSTLRTHIKGKHKEQATQESNAKDKGQGTNKEQAALDKERQ